MPQDTDGRWAGPTAFTIAPTTIDDGQSHSMADHRGLFVLHAALMRTGEVLCFSGHVETGMYAPLCYLFNPGSPGATLAPIRFPPGADLFCCHYVQLPDGRLLALGGSQHDSHHPVSGGVVYRGSTGSKTIGIFDPSARSWSVSRTGGRVNEMRQGRWYPTPVVLPDGRVAVFSGRRELDNAGAPPVGVAPPYIADMVEICSPRDWASTELSGASRDLPIYPGLHLAKDGRIYFTHTNWGQEIVSPNTVSILIGPNASSATWTDHGVNPPNPRREEGMSVLLPPAQDGKILVIGGSEARTSADVPIMNFGAGGTGPVSFHHIANAADGLQADELDTNTSPPTWTSVGPMNFPRINGHCVILPDATVLICGGHDNYKWQNSTATAYTASAPSNPSQFAEIYNPAAPAGSRFHTVALAERGDPGTRMGDPRMYHSVALLLPDGRVFTAGGADPNKEEPPPGGGAWLPVLTDNFAANWEPGRMYGPGTPLNTKTFEFYEPPYFFKGPRPTIDEVLRNGARTRRVEYGQTFTVRTTQASNITKIAFIRPGAPTHHTDTEQRYVNLDFVPGATNELTVTAVNDAKLAPPGYYMLWIVDSQNRPCQKAEFIQLVPRPASGDKCFIATATYESPDHPEVDYLRRLRAELRGSGPLGQGFMFLVNGVYESFSPQLAGVLDRDPDFRAAVRDVVVGPVVKTIHVLDAASKRLGQSVRFPGLVGLLAGAAGLGVAALPGIAAAVGAVTWRNKRRKRRSSGKTR